MCSILQLSINSSLSCPYQPRPCPYLCFPKLRMYSFVLWLIYLSKGHLWDYRIMMINYWSIMESSEGTQLKAMRSPFPWSTSRNPEVRESRLIPCSICKGVWVNPFSCKWSIHSHWEFGTAIALSCPVDNISQCF